MPVRFVSPSLSEPLRVLILGGTREGYATADAIAERASAFAPITSLAGRTSHPRIPAGALRVGGFGGAAGLAAYLLRERIAAVIDATHPFATAISANARDACARAGIPLVAFARRAWLPTVDDRWSRVADMASAAARARDVGERLFVTTGRRALEPFAAMADRFRLVRSVDRPAVNFAGEHRIVLGRGPFALDDELALMRAYAIDVLVTKDGGGAPAAKLIAARTLGIPVVVIEQPEASDATRVTSVEDVLLWLEARAAVRA